MFVEKIADLSSSVGTPLVGAPLDGAPTAGAYSWTNVELAIAWLPPKSVITTST